MAVTTDAPAPRPWYKVWWKLLLALFVWPFVLTFVVLKTNWNGWKKIVALAAIWVFALMTTAINGTPSTTSVPQQTIDTKSSVQVGAVAGESDINVITTTAVASPVPTVTSTPTEVPTATPVPTSRPTSTPTPRPTLKPTIVPRPTEVIIIKANPTAANGYPCNCSKTCPNMSSCAEAQYLLNVCGCTARDADHDGIACDADCQ